MALVNVKINGIDVKTEEGSTILQAAKIAGFEIPTLCHAEGLEPFTSCFICVVKVDGGRGNLVPSCATKVTEGMSVTVESDEIAESRRMNLNLLLSDHSGDCVAPCTVACPSSIDIQGFLSLVREGRESDAAKLIRETAPIPGALGRICPRPCETACRRNRVEDSISICYMKRHISDTEIKEFGQVQLPEPAPDTNKHVAIIGAGPAGMTAAYFLRLQGHSVTVFEAHAKSGGMLRYGIPYYRLTDQTLKDEFDAIEGLGVEVKYNTVIGRDMSAKHLEADYDALVIAIGAQGASSMRVEGEELPGVYSGIDYLGQIGEGQDPDIGKKVVVVGGGNTAIDVARTAVRKGAEVTVLYRRTRAEMPASSFEIDEALHEGVKIEFLAAPVKVEQNGNSVVVRSIRMELGEPDASGRRRPMPIKGSEYEIKASSVISAIGQKVVTDGIIDTGVGLTRWGTIVADPVTFMTDRPGIFTCGDCQTGADIAVRAVGNARKTAYSVNQFLNGEEVTGESEQFNSTMGALEDISEEVFKGYEKKPKVEMPLISDNERVTTFTEIETGFSRINAKEEAERCLECGCEAANECKLRIYSTEYGADQSYFAGDIRDFQNDHSHAAIKMEVNKCINCGACVRACAEIKGFNVLAYVGRGFGTRMVSPFGRSLVDTICDGCGECVTVCPTAGIMYQKGVKKEIVEGPIKGAVK